MFKNMRKSERQLDNDVYLNNSIYFHCAFEGNKIDNINFNNKVCFCVVENTEIIPNNFTTKYKSAVAFGQAFSISDEYEKKKVLYEFI
ncbi:pyridoxamine 5'-phosphate oxidase family protein [Clostridium tyrobutyricum]|uniref:pyridoxamine 5'-phosphate oxidase family protein n=1 Tax=Clostridium tyrobutyricum TaxID=1519 RepID=UPI0030D40DE3